MASFVLGYDKIIVGGSLAALLYGYKNNIPVVYVAPKIPLFFETYHNGKSKQELWHKLAFQLSLAGLIPASDRAVGYRVEADNILKVFTDEPFFCTFSYNELIVFDDDKLEGWDNALVSEKKYRVLDWISDRRSSPHDIAILKTADQFVEEVHFYPSSRIDGNWSGKKDILAISHLTMEQIKDPEYCDIYVRFKVLHMMKDAGIKGPKNGIHPKDPTKHKRLAIKLETELREVERLVVEPHAVDELLKNFRLENEYLDGKEN